MLKPLPQEPREPQVPTPAKIKNKTRAHFLRFEMTMPKVQKRKWSIFALLISRMANFMKRTEKISIQELSDLIHGLQRAVLALQKKRIELIRHAQRKKKS